jgi:hypothetical protein
MSDGSNLLWFLLGGAFALAGFLVVVVSLWGDRSKGRRRCPGCWYSMEGLNELRCPECGRVSKHEKNLRRTRRSWRWVIVGVLALGLGLGAVARPFIGAKNPWTVVPHAALGRLVPIVPNLSMRQRTQLLDAFVLRNLTPSEYDRVIRSYARLLNEEKQEMGDEMRYRIQHLHAPGDGSIMPGAIRDFVGSVADEVGNPHSLLSDTTAVEFAQSLVHQWRTDLEFPGQHAAIGLKSLAFFKPCVAKWALDALHREPVGWVVYSIDPRSDDGEAFRILLKEFRGDDAERSLRAGVALDQSFFAVTTRWRNIPSDLAWIKRDYPSTEELRFASDRVGDKLLGIAQHAQGERQRLAILALLDNRVRWRTQASALFKMRDSLPPELRSCIVNNSRPLRR